MSKRIFIADDEAALRFLISETLSDEGYDITEAEDGDQALNKLSTEAVDLIILDFMMPGLTGIEVCEALRKGGPNLNTPVILLTAKAQEKDRELAMEAGVTTYVTKPFSPIQLLDIVEELIL